MYIDIVSDSIYYDPVLSIIKKRVVDTLPVTNVSDTLVIPRFKYDLLIIDYSMLPDGKDSLMVIKSSYSQVIVINVPPVQESYNSLYVAGINYNIRKDFFITELSATINIVIDNIKSSRNLMYYDALMMFAQNSIVITDKKGVIQYANPYFEHMSKYSSAELESESVEIVASGIHSKEFYIDMWNNISSGMKWEGIFINKDRLGEKFYEEATISPMYNPNGNIEKYIKIGKNITRERLLLEELDREVKLAGKILNAFLPKNYLDSKINFIYQMQTFNQIGGDYVVFDHQEKNIYSIALIDVMGHGPSAAMFSIAISRMFRDYVDYMQLDDVVISINELMCSINNSINDDLGKYCTAVFVQIDTETNTISFVNAGHPDAIIYKRDGNTKLFESNSMMLGVMSSAKYEVKKMPLEDIERIIMFTDGIYDNTDQDIDSILKTFINDIPKDIPPEAIFKKFLRESNIKDDSCVCVLDIMP